jgi:hypothetical protein
MHTLTQTWKENMIELSQYSIVKFTEFCTVKFKIGNHPSIILCIYRSPSGKFGEFVVQLDLILEYVYKPKLKLIICGDLNVNFLIRSSSAQQLTFAIL